MWSPRAGRTQCINRGDHKGRPYSNTGEPSTLQESVGTVLLTFAHPTQNHRVSDAEATSCSSFAGVIATDSPHPQAEVWFGLLKTNPEENLSTR